MRTVLFDFISIGGKLDCQVASGKPDGFSRGHSHPEYVQFSPQGSAGVNSLVQRLLNANVIKGLHDRSQFLIPVRIVSEQGHGTQ